MKKSLIFALLLAGTSWPVCAAPDEAEGYKAVIKATPLLRASTTAAGQPISYPTTDHPEVVAVRVEIPPGAETGWHTHPYPCYGYVLSGDLSVELEGGKVNHLKAGDAVIEVVNMLHNGKNTGTDPVTIVMFVTGEKGEPFTVPASSSK